MNRWSVVLALFAEQSGFGEIAERVADQVQRNRAADSTRLMMIAAGLVAVVLLVWFLCRFSECPRKGIAFRSPRKLFFSLAKAHGLGLWDVWLLWRLIRLQHLAEPARIFLEPERFDPEAYPRCLARHGARLENLRRRLFAGLPELVQPAR